jgi:exopolyphosphatase/guanosine-5'-triphosphate,3'-diphosphate pyrophosphatase
VVRRIEPARVVFSATGLREGRLFALLPEAERRRDPLLAGAEELGALASRELGIGRAMTAWTAGLVPGETPARARLREAACHVADSGWREHPETRAREAFLRLVQYPFLGITHAERAMLGLAALVRYEGTRDDAAARRIVQGLREPEIAWAETLGEILELGFRVSAGIPAILAACPLRLVEGTLCLEAGHAAVPPEDESIRTRLKVVAARLGAARSAVVRR